MIIITFDMEKNVYLLKVSPLASIKQNSYFSHGCYLHAPLSIGIARQPLGLPRKYDSARPTSFIPQ